MDGREFKAIRPSKTLLAKKHVFNFCHSLSFMSLNVFGDLETKICCTDFIDCSNNYDVIILSETWTNLKLIN